MHHSRRNKGLEMKPLSKNTMQNICMMSLKGLLFPFPHRAKCYCEADSLTSAFCYILRVLAIKRLLYCHRSTYIFWIPTESKGYFHLGQCASMLSPREKLYISETAQDGLITLGKWQEYYMKTQHEKLILLSNIQIATQSWGCISSYIIKPWWILMRIQKTKLEIRNLCSHEGEQYKNWAFSATGPQSTLNIFKSQNHQHFQKNFDEQSLQTWSNYRWTKSTKIRLGVAIGPCRVKPSPGTSCPTRPTRPKGGQPGPARIP